MFGYSEEDLNKFSQKVRNDQAASADRDFLGKKSLEEELANLEA